MNFSPGQVPISRSPPFFSHGCSKVFGALWVGVLSHRFGKTERLSCAVSRLAFASPGEALGI